MKKENKEVKELLAKLEEKDKIIVLLANIVLLIEEHIKKINIPKKPTFLQILTNIPKIISLIALIHEQLELFRKNIVINNES